MRHHAGQDQRDAPDRAEPHGDDRQSHQATDEGAEEADQRSIGAVREHDRDVQRRAGAGHDLVRNALEGGDEFTEDDTNTVEDDAHADAELQGLRERGHEERTVVVGVGGEDLERFLGRQHDGGPHGEDQVQHDHEQRGGDHGVTQEAQALREVDVFSGLRLLAHAGADSTGDNVAEGVEVADRQLVATGHPVHERLRERRHDHHDHAHEDGADDHDEQLVVRAESHGQHHGQHGGHEHHVVAGQEDVFQRGEPREQQHHDEAEHDDVRRGGAVLAGRLRGDDLIGGHDAVRAGGLEHQVAERGQSRGDDGSAGTQDQVAHGRLQGARHDLPGAALQCDQADGRDDANQIRRHIQYFLADEIQHLNDNVHGFLLFLLWFLAGISRRP